VASNRGVGSGPNENNIDAFICAVRQGASVVELDVTKLKDGELVLCHDEKVDGTRVETLLAQLGQHALYVVRLADCRQGTTVGDGEFPAQRPSATS
jgi:glycerophosphoryl diester phosphodiesterase